MQQLECSHKNGPAATEMVNVAGEEKLKCHGRHVFIGEEMKIAEDCRHCKHRMGFRKTIRIRIK